MVLEVAVFSITPAHKARFEAAFAEARTLIAAMPGHVSNELQRCIETDGRYVLLVHWLTVDDHMIGFRESPQFQQWRALLGPYFAAAPAVEHYELVTP
jgi:heme-degrading monooxygenase HmoA